MRIKSFCFLIQRRIKQYFIHFKKGNFHVEVNDRLVTDAKRGENEISFAEMPKGKTKINYIVMMKLCGSLLIIWSCN